MTPIGWSCPGTGRCIDGHYLRLSGVRPGLQTQGLAQPAGLLPELPNRPARVFCPADAVFQQSASAEGQE